MDLLANRWSFRLNRHLISLLARACRVPLKVGVVEKAIESRGLAGVTARESEDSSRGVRSGRKWFNPLSHWPLIIEVVCLCCFVRILINLYYQYQLDWHNFKLRQLMKRFQILAPSEEERHRLSALQGTARELRARLKTLGAPFVNLRFGGEIGYIYSLSLALLVYFQGTIALGGRKRIQFGFGRVILSMAHERSNFLKLAQDEMSKIIASSQSFTMALMNSSKHSLSLPREMLRNISSESREDLHRLEEAFIGRYRFEPPNSADKLKRIVKQHEESVYQLRRVALDERFEPLSWSPKWLALLSDLHCFYICSTISYCYLILAASVVYLPFHLDIELEITGPMDIVALFEAFFVFNCIIFAMIFFSAVVLFDTLDQVRYISKLRGLLGGCAAKNRLRSACVQELISRCRNGASSFHLEIEAQCSQMNCDLIHCLIHYKIFVSQSGKLKRTFSIVAASTAILLFLLPISCRIHLPYLEPELKHFYMMVSLTSSVLVNFILVPICHLLCRSLAIYKSLSSLLAQIVESTSLIDDEDQLSTGQRRLIYNKHLVCLIRKELDYPLQLLDQFAIRLMGIKFDYGSLIKINFWYSIMLLSMVPKAESSFFMATLLRDPFGLLDY